MGGGARFRPDRDGHSSAGPLLTGPKGEFARRVVRIFVDGGRASAPLVVLSGPADSGKSALADWACRLGGSRVFRIDPDRLRGGSGFVPRKPLVVVDGIDIVARAAGAQRRLLCIIDAVRDRGDRMLVTMEGLPGEASELHEALRCRLTGGLVVSLPAADRATRRLQLREEARRVGRRLPSRVEDELAELPAREGLETLRHRLAEGTLHSGAPPAPPLERMKDLAAKLFHVERSLLDDPVKRRSVVEARRAIMAAAIAEGVEIDAVRRSFRVSAPRTVREACRWAERKSERDHHFARMVSELGRVAADR